MQQKSVITFQPDGNIYPLLRDNISPGAIDLTNAFNATQNAALQELVFVIETLIFNITDIMVSDIFRYCC